jgi:hypothetical protein
MARPQKDPLRRLTAEERSAAERISRSPSLPAGQVARAKALLAVADGQSFTAAARAGGRRSGDAVAHLVARFNREGVAALVPRHGGGPATVYGPAEQTRILAEVRRTPDRQQDGTATWSLTTLRRALRRAPDGLPQVSTFTIWMVLRAAGRHWQQSRTWCPTGTALRKRKDGSVVQTGDPDTGAKKGRLNAPIGWAN